MVQIIKSSILTCIRDKKNLIFSMVFPIFLIFLLGTVLSTYFKQNDSNTIEDIQVTYLDEGNENTNEIFKTLKSLDTDAKLKFKEAKSVDEGIKEVKVNRAVFLHFNGNKVHFYSNDKSMINSSVVYGMLNSVTNGYNVTVEMFRVNKNLAQQIVANGSYNNSSIFSVEKISKQNTPSSMDYYGVAEIGLMVFYFFKNPMYYLKEEKKKKIKDRIKLSGLSLPKYYIGSFIGYSLVSYLTLIPAFLVAKYILGVNYGENSLVFPLALVPFITMVVAIGIVLSLIFKEEINVEKIIQAVIVPALGFLGGGYIALGENAGPVLNIITGISPLRWFNRGLFRYIYGGDSRLIIRWILVTTIITIVLLVIIYILGRREERIHEQRIGTV